MELLTLLTEMLQQDASDLHLVVGQPPVFRRDGALVRREGPALEADTMEALLLPHLTEEARTQLTLQHQDIEIALRLEGRVCRFHVYRERGHWAATIRPTPQKPPTLDLLFPEAEGIGQALHSLLALPRGLILVTGPTGSGKTTTCIGMLETMNRTQARRIVTLEDPITYELISKQSLITQRSVGQDVTSFARGAFSAFREDLDVIFISEMRDLETVQYAFALAESGHLVFATLHLENATDAVNRLIEVFPEPRDLIRRMVARNLVAVIAQRLVARGDRPGR
ncbi:MAG TPA: ATPase, T2SS/T4P/T4SS family, partial [Chthonomonadaceae bacterium]|nr:ATPase, T2SS/T4P/T4SS family [Chthonomonadaceae bacterium]